MKTTEMKELLGKLVDLQESCAPIELRIGRVGKDNVVRNGCIVIKEAPPMVASKLMEYGYHLDITQQGVIVEKH